MTNPLRIASAALLLAVLAPAGEHARVQPAEPRVIPAGARDAYGKLPLTFEENRGQTDPVVQYVSRGPGYTVFLTVSEAVVRLRQNTVVRMTLDGAAQDPRVVPVDRRSSTSNYLIGNDPAQWQRDVPSYSSIRYEQVYPGIDLVYYGNQRQLEYDFVVAPGADPRRIRLDFTGADSVEVASDGDLVLGVDRDRVRFHAPVTYQTTATGRRSVEGHYVLNDTGQVGFGIGDYDPALPLVIDPILSYSTYFGGSGADYAFGIAVDPAGNVYVTGATSSNDFPTSPSAYNKTYGTNLNVTPPFGDAFIVKLNAAGSLVYSTYVGGSASDSAYGIAVDAGGNAYITGGTSSTNFPTTAGSFQPNWGNYPFGSNGDAFVLKLNASGSALVYSSFLSGDSLAAGYGIAVDSSGSAYVTGQANYRFPTTNPLVLQFTSSSADLFVAKVTPSGSSLAYAKLLGAGGFEEGYGVAVDTTGNAYVTGYTTSSNFPLTSAAQSTYGGSQDAIVAKFNATGGVVYSTFLGGNDLDIGGAIAVDSSGNAYVTGRAGSSSFPVTAGALQTTFLGFNGMAFVTKFSPTGAVGYSTFLGGSLAENGTARGFETFGGIAVDSAGSAVVVGSTRSTNFPVKEPIQATNHGSANTDAFVAKLNATGSALLFSTFLGGDANDQAYGVALDSSGFAYVAGATSSTNFPTASPYQSTRNTAADLFIAKIDPTPAPTMSLDRTALAFTATTTGASFTSKTGTQQVRLLKGGPGVVTWTASSSTPWLVVSPTSGTGSAVLNLSVQFASGLTATQTGNITLTFSGAGNSAGPIAVTLKTMTATAAAAPVGAIDTPLEGATGVAGSIAVTGWVLDDVETTRVRILRDPVAGETPGVQVFIGDGVFVDGARTDIQAAFPGVPLNSRAGWGYLMLTNFLPALGNGTFKLYAYADDAEGHTTLLGTRTITCTNSASLAPFGAIDTPGQGEVISGTAYNNFGWALSPGTRRADVPGGGTVSVLVDGVSLGVPAGWVARGDLSALFPLANFAGVGTAAAAFTMNTTTLANGVHTIAWIVTANSGGTSGVGSRFFTVSNGALFADPRLASARSIAANVIARDDAGPLPRAADVDALPIDRTLLRGRRGFDLAAPLHTYPVVGDRMVVHAEELDRIELQMGGTPGSYAGYLRTGDTLAALPIGSTLEASDGTFIWMPGVAFVGAYDLVFVRSVEGHAAARREMRIVLHPKGSGRVGSQVTIDTPESSASVSRSFVLAGWAADLDADMGSGVDAVHVWAYHAGADPIFLGAAAYGGARPDVAAIYGDRFGPSGFGMTIDQLEPGTYDLAVFAWSTVTGGFVPAKIVRVTVR